MVVPSLEQRQRATAIAAGLAFVPALFAASGPAHDYVGVTLVGGVVLAGAAALIEWSGSRNTPAMRAAMGVTGGIGVTLMLLTVALAQPASTDVSDLGATVAGVIIVGGLGTVMVVLALAVLIGSLALRDEGRRHRIGPSVRQPW